MKLLVSVIVPVGPNETHWSHLMPTLKSIPQIGEVIFCGVESAPPEFQILSTGSAQQVKWEQCGVGRALQMNHGAECAEYPFLWFLHADSRWQGRYDLSYLEFNKHSKVLIYFDLRFHPTTILMKLNEVGVKIRSDFMGMPFGDQGFILSKDLFHRVRGFDEDLAYGEDHILVWKVKIKGARLLKAPGRILTSSRKYQKNGWLKTTLLHLWLTYKQAIPMWWSWRVTGERK